MLGEDIRKRFIYAHRENSSYSTCEFVKRAIIWYRYAPDTIQTDHVGEFTNTQKTNHIHQFDILCDDLHITHKVLRPRIPWHNGKVERSHRNDQERFYNHLRFYSFDDLLIQMKFASVRSRVLAPLGPPKQANLNPVPIGDGFGFVVYLNI